VLAMARTHPRGARRRLGGNHVDALHAPAAHADLHVADPSAVDQVVDALDDPVSEGFGRPASTPSEPGLRCRRRSRAVACRRAPDEPFRQPPPRRRDSRRSLGFPGLEPDRVAGLVEPRRARDDEIEGRGPVARGRRSRARRAGERVPRTSNGRWSRIPGFRSFQ
jgi:hypothetical protein